MDARKKKKVLTSLQDLDIQHLNMLNIRRENLMIPPESEPTPFATASNTSSMQSPVIWDVGCGAEWRIFLNKEHVQEGDSDSQKPELLSRLNLISFFAFLI